MNQMISGVDKQRMKEMADFAKKIASDNWYCRKRIYGGPKKEENALAAILVGYCPDTLAYFQVIFEEARKSFPDLDPAEVTCAKVEKSSSVQGFTVILFRVPNKPVDGWAYYDSLVDFFW